jgi:protein required for attachment to host cells
MAKIGLVHDLWILVCDGRKALLFQNVGDRTYPKLETRETMEHDLPPTRELGTDEPGRIFSASGGQRGAVEPTDFHTQEEQRFLARLARHVDRFATEHHVRKLILVAPPRALGMLREALPHHLRTLVLAEVDKDYVSQPVYEIEKHLAKALAN